MFNYLRLKLLLLANYIYIIAILGFITRNCKDFTNHVIIKILYTSLVRSKLDYNTVVCSSYLNYHQIQCLNNIQNRFLKFMAFKCNLSSEQHSPYY